MKYIMVLSLLASTHSFATPSLEISEILYDATCKIVCGVKTRKNDKNRINLTRTTYIDYLGKTRKQIDDAQICTRKLTGMEPDEEMPSGGRVTKVNPINCVFVKANQVKTN